MRRKTMRHRILSILGKLFNLAGIIMILGLVILIPCGVLLKALTLEHIPALILLMSVASLWIAIDWECFFCD